MTPQQMSKFGIFYLQEAVLAILEDAPEEGLKPSTIGECLGIPLYKDDEGYNGRRRFIQGILIKLEKENLVQQVEREHGENRRWKIQQGEQQ